MHITRTKTITTLRVDKSCGSTEEYGDDDFDNCHGAKLKTKTQKLKVYREYFRG